MTAAWASLGEVIGSGAGFRVARAAVLLLILALPLEAVTAVRETALIGGTALLASHLWLSGQREFRSTVLFWPLAVYVAVAALSIITAVDWSYSLKELRAEVLKGLMAFYLGVHFVRQEEHLVQAWAAVVVGAGIMGLMGLILFAQAGGSFLHHYVRAGSLHNGYGGFGTYLSLVWPFLLLAPMFWRGARWRWAAVAAAVLALICAYLTFSRATWVALMVETVLVATMLSRRRLRIALVAAALGVLLGAALLTVPGSRHGERWQRLWDDPSKVGGTAGDLLSLWRHSWGYIKEHPFTGIGLGRHSFSQAFPEFRRTHQPLLWHAHNMFVEAALQMGVQGLIALVVVLAVLVAALWPHAPPATGDGVGLFTAATAAMVVGFAVRNLSDDFFVDDTGIMFWLLAGLAMGGRWLTKSGRARPK